MLQVGKIYCALREWNSYDSLNGYKMVSGKVIKEDEDEEEEEGGKLTWLVKNELILILNKGYLEYEKNTFVFEVLILRTGEVRYIWDWEQNRYTEKVFKKVKV